MKNNNKTNINVIQVTKYILFLLVGVLIGTGVTFLLNPSKVVEKSITKTNGDKKFE